MEKIIINRKLKKIFYNIKESGWWKRKRKKNSKNKPTRGEN